MSAIHIRAPRHHHRPGLTGGAGLHDMVVFGTGVDCYLSYRPTFQAPYNFQILLAVELDERGSRALGADRRIGYADIHTFDPEDFPVAELDPARPRPRRSFRGTLIRGRRERGGVAIATEVRATVRRVIHFAELDPARERGRGLLTHLCFGRPDRLYLAHHITRQPSFDQIVSARLIPGTVTDLLGEPLPDDVAGPGFPHAQPIILGQREFTGARLRAGELAVAAFPATAGGAQGFLAEIAVERQIYLEVADLA
ncbi:hypothetical protein DFR70_101245 [Nocardia tenerifensis]|uniref:Uncharacterized protein n=1 Tax=Nocardia tenerifensis TaxID=228006 RepID=A0A318KY36_9NOCA|nr:hypothetical protein [Nocardia tenerifensis]PXX70824.1 hypothetical protein DFR70_101245 [Nocardia tenerifensis]